MIIIKINIVDKKYEPFLNNWHAYIHILTLLVGQIFILFVRHIFALFIWLAEISYKSKKKKKKRKKERLKVVTSRMTFFSVLQNVIEMWTTWQYLFHNALIAVYVLKHKYFVLGFNAEIVKAIAKCFNTAIWLQVAGQPICCRGMFTARACIICCRFVNASSNKCLQPTKSVGHMARSDGFSCFDRCWNKIR